MATLSSIITPTNLVTLTGTATLTNKTLTAPTIASANLTTALTLAGAAGTNGQVLTSAGSGLPSWTTPSAGALTLLSTVTASASATIDIETTFNSTYDVYLIEASGISVAGDGAPLVCQMKIGGSYLTTSTYSYHAAGNSSSNAAYSAYTATTTTNIYFIDNIGNAANRMANFYMHVLNPSSTTKSKMVTWQGGAVSANGTLFSNMGSGLNTGTAALTGIRFWTNGSGNITAGSFRLYGIANS